MGVIISSPSPGIRLVMITVDQVPTAVAMAKQMTFWEEGKALVGMIVVGNELRYDHINLKPDNETDEMCSIALVLL